MSAGAQLLEETLAHMRRIRLLLETDGLKVRQFNALRALDVAPLRVGALAKAVEIRTPSAVTLVDSLVERGLVERRADTEDGRASVVELTARGRRTLRTAEQRLVVAFDELVVGTLAR